MAKTGRKQKPYVCTWNGEPVAGLYRVPGSNRWRVVATGERFTEADERQAVQRFRRMEARRNGSEALVAIPLVTDADDPDAAGAIEAVLRHDLGPGEHRAKADDSYVLRIPANADPVAMLRAVPEAALWAYVAEEIRTRPKYVAEQTGIEQIGYLYDLKKPTPSPTLEEVGNLYFDKSGISGHWLRKTKMFWAEFSDSVGVRTLREIEQEHVAGYKDDVLTSQRDEDRSPTYVKHRFGQVKTVLAYSKNWGKWSDDRVKVLGYASILTPPSSVTLDPDPIDPADFAKLLDKADAQQRAVLLLALNCCLYGAEVADVRWPDLDLDKGTFIADRGKTKVVRVGVLWKQTVEALRALPRIADVDAVFVTNATKQVHNANTIGKLFRDLRTVAELPAVKMCQVRDGSYSAAAEGDGVEYVHARILGGHRTGMSDHYVKRRPRIVEKACAAVEAAYFG